MINMNLEKFIAKHITKRSESLFRNDLLSNAQRLNEEINGKSVLIIGGAGTIGASYIKALLKYNPSSLIVIDISENGLTELTRDLRSTYDLKVPDVYKTYPVNFGDPVFNRILKNEGPFDIVANFAAHKHVRSEKDAYSITALIENNVLKAEILLNKLLSNPPNHFFCVSTDKAANPANIMGASKKIMEELILAYSRLIPITTARFANVAFSNGSLLYGFLERMMKRQPLTAPSDVKRYFVSPEESGQICLLACMLGESGDIFFPKLEETGMTTFSSIADKFLFEMGLAPIECGSEEEAKMIASEIKDDSKEYPVYYFTSDTSGEKMFEEFYTEDEIVDLNSFASLGVIKNGPRRELDEVLSFTGKLTGELNRKDISKAEIVNTIKDFLPGFNHIETGKSLDQKM